MISSYKKKYRLMFALAFLCGIQFFFLPFFHYHPGNTHSHNQELSVHHHPAHFHSHELDTLTHFIHHEYSANAEHHHSDSDKEHHHSEPFWDTKTLTFNKPQLVKASSPIKIMGALSCSTLRNVDFSSHFSPEISSQYIAISPARLIARSPPATFI